MGSSTGLASGFGKFGRFGFNQLAMAVSGDSTFFHATIPALINAIHHKSNLILLLMDNSVTAMTGFQPHPGSAVDAMGDTAVQVNIEDLCRSIGCRVDIADPFEPQDAQERLKNLAAQEGVKVFILRQACGLVRFRNEGREYRVWVEEDKCLGEKCGCGRYCNRSIQCPALIWDPQKHCASIAESLCTGCGFCTNVCPRDAIKKEVYNEN
jgi:indolepyruvate ferredoxin oxidoreductase alpha subunit